MPWDKVPKSSKKKKLAKKTVVSKKDVTNIVKKTINRAAEKKQTDYEPGVNSMFNATNASYTIHPLTPYTGQMVIAQGTGQGQRIGNKIRVNKALLRLVMYPRTYNATTNNAPIPQNIIVFIFGMKPNLDTFSDANSIILNSFFQNGNGSYGITSSILDQVSQVNSDQVTLFYKKSYKLGVAAYTGSGNQAAQQFYNNNDYKYSIVKTLDITKHYPKILAYNDTDTVATSRGVYMAVVPYNADGSIPIASQIMANYEFQLTMTYTDF